MDIPQFLTSMLKKQYEEEIIEKIIEGTPMQYITNYQEFIFFFL